MVPGSFTSGTRHFEHSGQPADVANEAQYETRYPWLMKQVAEKLAALAPQDADALMVSEEIARIVALPAGQRPYRVHVDPADDGSEEVSNVGDPICKVLGSGCSVEVERQTGTGGYKPDFLVTRGNEQFVEGSEA